MICSISFIAFVLWCMCFYCFYSVSQKTEPLQLISHNFINSQHSLNIIQFSIEHDKKFLNWFRTSCVVSITTVQRLDTPEQRTSQPSSNSVSSTGQQKTSSKTIVGLCRYRKTAFEHVLQLLIPQNILLFRQKHSLFEDLSFLFIRQHKLWNDAQLRIATVTRFSWYFAANTAVL